jgi:7,8-dihydropterin-6-yl-methyl-4-(beta-D-ribofuranosyl)aminobenzene 5'-phosphate synthase
MPLAPVGDHDMERAQIGSVDSLRLVVLIENAPAYDTYLEGCFGLSLWLELRSGEALTRVLFDVGPRADTLFRNAESLGVDLDAVDSIALSHCHFDHTAALSGVLARLGREVPVYGHPALFRQCFVLAPAYMDYSMAGDNSRQNLEQLGARFALAADASEPLPGLVLTGEVAHVTDFEEQGGVSCFTIDENGATVPDRLEDDVSAVVNVKDLGLVVLAGCSHAGIVNIVKQAAQIGGQTPVAAVAGGFHLLQASSDRTARTIAALKQVAPSLSFIAPMHCTGLVPSAMMAEAYRGAFRELHVGDEVTFRSGM